MTVGIYFFKYPNNFATGGLSGISVLVESLCRLLLRRRLSGVMNVVLLLVGFAFLGRRFGIRTVYYRLLMSAFLFLFEAVLPLDKPLTDEPLHKVVKEIDPHAFVLISNTSDSIGKGFREMP